MHTKAHNLRFDDPYRRPGDWCGFWKSKHICFGMMGELDIELVKYYLLCVIDDITHNATYPTHFKGLQGFIDST